MNITIVHFFFILLLAANNLAAKPNSLPIEKITFYTENYPPANYIEHGELKGISIDTIKAIWKHIQIPEQNILLVPWARGYRYLLEQSNSALFTMSRTEARENLFKWVGPMFNSTHVLIAKKSKQYNFTNLGQTFHHSVVAVKGDISEISLLQVGFPADNLAKVMDAKQGFLMMQNDRVDMIALSIHGFYYLVKSLNFDPNEYETVWKVNKIGNYIAFNNQTSDSLIEALQVAFEQIEAERIKIKQKYHLPLEEY
jgi:polar amino acid transport system substrate-binding protein